MVRRLRRPGSEESWSQSHGRTLCTHVTPAAKRSALWSERRNTQEMYRPDYIDWGWLLRRYEGPISCGTSTYQLGIRAKAGWRAVSFHDDRGGIQSVLTGPVPARGYRSGEICHRQHETARALSLTRIHPVTDNNKTDADQRSLVRIGLVWNPWSSASRYSVSQTLGLSMFTYSR